MRCGSVRRLCSPSDPSSTQPAVFPVLPAFPDVLRKTSPSSRCEARTPGVLASHREEGEVLRSTSGKAGKTGKTAGWVDEGSEGEHRRRTEPQRMGGRPLRVALVVPPYFDVPPAAYGGVEAVVADLADGLVDQGHQVYLIGAGKPGTSATFIPVWDRIVPERLGEPYPEVMHAVATRRAVQRLAGEVGLDVVHENTLSGPLNAPVYADLGLPTVVTVHGPVDGEMFRYYGELGQDVSLVAISHRQRALAA